MHEDHGQAHPHLALSLNNLEQVYHFQGRCGSQADIASWPDAHDLDGTIPIPPPAGQRLRHACFHVVGKYSRVLIPKYLIFDFRFWKDTSKLIM